MKRQVGEIRRLGIGKQALDEGGGGGGACLSHTDDSSAPARQSPASDALLAAITVCAHAAASSASDWSHPRPELHNPPRLYRACESGTLETGAIALSSDPPPRICRNLERSRASTPSSGPSGWREPARANGEFPPSSLLGRPERSVMAPVSSICRF